jgi:hypothetical protein
MCDSGYRVLRDYRYPLSRVCQRFAANAINFESRVAALMDLPRARPGAARIVVDKGIYHTFDGRFMYRVPG